MNNNCHLIVMRTLHFSIHLVASVTMVILLSAGVNAEELAQVGQLSVIKRGDPFIGAIEFINTGYNLYFELNAFDQTLTQNREEEELKYEKLKIMRLESVESFSMGLSYLVQLEGLCVARETSEIYIEALETYKKVVKDITSVDWFGGSIKSFPDIRELCSKN